MSQAVGSIHIQEQGPWLETLDTHNQGHFDKLQAYSKEMESLPKSKLLEHWGYLRGILTGKRGKQESQRKQTVCGLLSK